MISAEALLEAEDITVRIAGQDVVDGVALKVLPGQKVAVVGESGSGKTMTCRALLGALHRVGGELRGTIRIAGEDLADGPAGRVRALRGSTIGFVPQGSMVALDPVMRVGGQLVETIRRHESRRTAEARARELLELVEIADAARVLRAFPHQLSGGMRQRVMIALALAGRPKLLIADEPTTALDVTIESAVLRLLARLCDEERMSLLIVTHDISVVRRIADQVVVMYRGVDVESGPARAVLKDPKHPYTRALLAADPALTPPGQRLRGPDADGGDLSCAHPDGCRGAARTVVGDGHTIRCAHEEVADVGK